MPAKKKKQNEDNVPKVLNGVFMFPNSDKYDGDYMRLPDGKVFRHGMGRHVSADGTVYSGNWENDKMSGLGKLEYSSGASYDGEFLDNQFHGNGTYYWPDGSIYKGHFTNNRAEGFGEFLDPDGQEWEGEFNYKAALGLKFKLNF